MRVPVVVVVVSAAAACGPRLAIPDTSEVVTRAERNVDAFTNTEPVLAGDTVVFVSNRDGLPQLYAADARDPEAPARRLPTPAQRVSDPALAADGKTIVFLSDVGSDQNYHLFAVGLDGGDFTDLTPDGTLHRDPPVIARRAGTLVYIAHANADQTTHVVVQTLGGPPRDVYTDPSVGYLADVSDDGRRAAYVRVVSDTEAVLLSLDLATGAATRLYPPEGTTAAIGDAALSPDGARVYVTTEAADRPPRIVRLDAATGAEQARHDETAVGSIAQLALASDRLVVGFNAGDHSELRVLDLELRPLPAPALPLAAVRLGRVAGGTLALTISSAAGPTDISRLDLATGAIAPLRREPRPGLGRPPRATIERLDAFDHRVLPVNLYLPDGPTTRRPTLVLVHGGPSGSAKIAWSSTIGFWTAMGFAVVAPNIRGSTGFGLDYQMADDRERRADAARDIETVNRWARSQPWCDGDRIVIGGISYGGYMTLLALTRQPDLWAAGIDGSGMSNLKTMEELEDQVIRAYDDTEFGKLGVDDALLAEWSPLTAVDRIVAPVFVYQGVNDPVTPQAEADQIVAALRARRIPVEYMLLGDEGHGLTKRQNQIAYLVRSYRFVARHLGIVSP